MNQRQMIMMPKLIPSLSVAGILGSLCTIAYSFVYAYSHGSTTVNKMGSVLGLNELEWGRISAIIPVLLWAALLAFWFRINNRTSRLIVIGYRLASAGMAMRVISEIPQLFINIRTEYNSPLGIGSWMLYLLSMLVLTAGMLLIGIGCLRAGMSGAARYAPLLVGLLIVPTIAAGGILSGISDDSTIFRLSTGLLAVPQGLAWLWLSVVPSVSEDRRFPIEQRRVMQN